MVDGVPDWLDELDLHVGAPDAAMGTRGAPMDSWFCVDGEWDSQRRAAADVLATEPGVCVGDLDGPSAGALLVAIAAWLGTEPPPIGEPALLRARRLVADDLCLLERGDDGWVLTGACVCFPSYWEPAAKVGRTLADVHAPVPGYPGPLAARVDSFLDRLPADRLVRRRNWSIHDRPDLHVPLHRAVPDAGVPSGRWLRSERQTLRAVPGTRAVVFTIRTQQVPLAVVSDRPDVGRRLADAIEGWAPAVRAYKGSAAGPDVVAWLRDPTTST